MLLSKNVNQKFESKSQLETIALYLCKRCYQRTLIKSLKANHNQKQTQYMQLQLLSKNVNQKFESKSQRGHRTCLLNRCCYQRTLIKSLKANHNYEEVILLQHHVVIKER